MRLRTDPLPVRRAEPGPPWAVLAAVSAGGVLGACARHGLALAWPHRVGQFPWSTLVTNVSGCLLIGVLMVLIMQARSAHRLVRPFLGVGVLGGFTTFSTYVLDAQRLVAAGRAGTALAYLAGTLIGALAAVYAGLTVTRLALGTRGHPAGPAVSPGVRDPG